LKSAESILNCVFNNGMQDDAAIDLSVLASAEMTLRKVLIVCREGVWTTRIHRVVTYTKKRVRNGRSLQSSKEFSFSFCDQN